MFVLKTSLQQRNDRRPNFATEHRLFRGDTAPRQHMALFDLHCPISSAILVRCFPWLDSNLLPVSHHVFRPSLAAMTRGSQ